MNLFMSVFYVIGYAIIFFCNALEISYFGELSWESRIIETYHTHDGISLMDCVSKCEDSDGCCSINYSRLLLLCELNYKTKENGTLYSDEEDMNGFINSNIASWPNTREISCSEKSCGPNKQCSKTTGACVVVDCGKAPNGPPKSYLQYYGHHVVGNVVVYACEQDYNLFQGTKVLEGNRIVVRCTETGEWEIDEFTCKACDVPNDCQDIKRHFSSVSGVYHIKPIGSESYIEVYCDIDMKASAWTVFQRRMDGSVNFFSDWEAYKKGFGNVYGEYWLGNDLIHKITSQNTYRLKIDLGDYSGRTRFAKYETFSIGDEESNYRLNVASYDGTAGDALQFHNHRKFSTKDKDNDAHNRDNCAMDYEAGWWFKGCLRANLNGKYFNTSHTSQGSKIIGIVWKEWLWPSTLKTSTMKIARNNYEIHEAKSCEDVETNTELTSGVYRIKPEGSSIKYFVYCEFEQTHAWTVIQRRITGSENFNRQSEDYIHGFGNFHGEFWLGTAAIHAITNERSHILRVEVIDFCNKTWFAEYSHFQVGNQDKNYKLSISEYSGTAGDTFGLENDLPFTTVSTASCPIHYTGAWWYNGCPFPNLNGAYNKTNRSGITWNNWKGKKRNLKGTTMKIRF